jgi:hypothetical protein
MLIRVTFDEFVRLLVSLLVWCFIDLLRTDGRVQADLVNCARCHSQAWFRSNVYTYTGDPINYRYRQLQDSDGFDRHDRHGYLNT